MKRYRIGNNCFWFHEGEQPACAVEADSKKIEVKEDELEEIDEVEDEDNFEIDEVDEVETNNELEEIETKIANPKNKARKEVKAK